MRQSGFICFKPHAEMKEAPQLLTRLLHLRAFSGKGRKPSAIAYRHRYVTLLMLLLHGTLPASAPKHFCGNITGTGARQPNIKRSQFDGLSRSFKKSAGPKRFKLVLRH